MRTITNFQSRKALDDLKRLSRDLGPSAVGGIVDSISESLLILIHLNLNDTSPVLHRVVNQTRQGRVAF